MRTPVDISRFLYSPGRKLLGLAIKLVNKPGALLTTLEVISRKYRINILHIDASSRPENPEVTVFYILDLTDLALDVRKLVSELRELDTVLDVEVIEPVLPGFVYDTARFPVLVSGRRAVIFDELLLRGLSEFRERYGSVASAFLYYQGYSIGQRLHRAYVEEYPSYRTPQEMIHVLRARFQAMGLGILEVAGASYDVNKYRIVLRLHECFECRGLEREGKRAPVCHFVRGLLAGFFTALLRAKTGTCTERACTVQGSPYCEFEVAVQQ